VGGKMESAEGQSKHKSHETPIHRS